MSEPQPIYRQFHPLVADAYTAVHQWLETTVQDANGYKALPYNNLKQKLQETDWKHIAFQYYALFPAHYFKAAHSLEFILKEEQLISWLRHKQKVCILDIGCGAGAASAAFLETVIRLKEQGKLTNEVNIILIGVDPSHRAIGLYIQMMTNLKSASSHLINLEFTSVHQGFPNAINDINTYLRNELLSSDFPCLSNVLVMQLNIISPFSQIYRNSQANFEELRALGIDVDGSTTENNLGLGTSEAQAYKQLIESVPIDFMHILTIGTKNMEKQVQIGTNSEITLDERIKEMVNTLHQIVGNRHSVHQISSENYFVYFNNPQNCHWRDKSIIQYHAKFYADFLSICSADLAADQDWNGVISLDNLRLAWARAHNNLLREALCDETEMRLFERDIEVRLYDLHEQLNAYYDDVTLTNDLISYKVPKNAKGIRPKGLSRIEEEILSVAIIQKLGDKTSQLRGSSYAYKISGKHNNRDTEYLYEYWFEAYCYYMKKARDSASNYPNGAILRVDIESFYTKIIQDQLCTELSRELTVSERVRWLIRLLLSKNIDEHELGQGITQGSIGSGFYANIYLTSVDAKFGSGNEWGVEFHRYVDDMIIIIPNPEDMDVIESILTDELQKLGLNLNDKKTEKIYEVSSFLEQCNDDEFLDKLNKRFDSVLNPLWILNSEHRAIFSSSYHNDELWWHNIERYQQCLRAIRIYTHNTDLSRKIYKYLFKIKSRDKDLSNQKEILELEGELKSTQPPEEDSSTAIIQWAASFTSSNNIWDNKRDELRRDLVKLFQDSWQSLHESDGSNSNKIRKLQRYIRFALYRLSILGFEDIRGVLMEILREAFWIIRDLINVLENLARQGYLAEIRSLLVYYQNLEQSAEYLKAITIRAMRFLPNIDAQEWELIVEFATISDGSVSIAERLMATETWLYLGHKYNDFKQSHHIEAVKTALRYEPAPPSRLQKNYLLILGQFEPNAVQEFSVNINDLMLVSARNLALEGNPSDIFDLPELKILRENYYSGQGPTDSEEGSP
ncbi:hypothetical protein C7B67_25590 [filamentous cyanobacterium Phorm 6]|nr:hypothetical protein C7B67_25590 [filamentous cyanobacterium Phorm 6]